MRHSGQTRWLDLHFSSHVITGHKGDGGLSMFLERFVADAKASGMVAELIKQHGQTGKLAVPA